MYPLPRFSNSVLYSLYHISVCSSLCPSISPSWFWMYFRATYRYQYTPPLNASACKSLTRVQYLFMAFLKENLHIVKCTDLNFTIWCVLTSAYTWLAQTPIKIWNNLCTQKLPSCPSWSILLPPMHGLPLLWLFFFYCRTSLACFRTLCKCHHMLCILSV